MNHTMRDIIVLCYVWNGLFVNITKNKITLHALRKIRGKKNWNRRSNCLSSMKNGFWMDAQPQTAPLIEKSRTWYCHKIASKSEAILLWYGHQPVPEALTEHNRGASLSPSCILRPRPSYFLWLLFSTWNQKEEERGHFENLIAVVV